MGWTDLARTRRRARFRYEWARLRRAVFGFAPALILIAVAAAIGPRPGFVLGLGAAMFGVGVTLLWYGRDLRRAVLPGIVAGTIPLTVTLCANHLGHVCTGGACVSLCLPACAAGGLAAGLVVAGVGHRSRHGWGFWAAGSAVALLTGAMGCTCVGYTGLLGLAAGYGVGALLAASRTRAT